jgi:outer membrane protein TolC
VWLLVLALVSAGAYYYWSHRPAHASSADPSAPASAARSRGPTVTPVAAAQRSLDIATYQYKAGTVDYLTVITTQAILLEDQRTSVDLLTRRMVASAALIQALGGGWDTSKLPGRNEIASAK